MQKLEGDGLVFVHAGGTVIERHLAEGEDAARRHRLRRRPDARHRLRHRARRQGQVDALRRRRRFLRAASRAGHGVAAKPAVLAPRGSHHRQHAIGGIERQFRLQFRLRQFRQRRQRRRRLSHLQVQGQATHQAVIRDMMPPAKANPHAKRGKIPDNVPALQPGRFRETSSEGNVGSACRTEPAAEAVIRNGLPPARAGIFTRC